MKKTIVSKLVLSIVIFSIISCGKTSIDETEEADVATSASLASSDETQSPYSDTYICGLPDVAPEYSAFNKYSAVIVEWGDSVELTDINGNVHSTVYSDEDKHAHICFAVKFIKLFGGTAENREAYKESQNKGDFFYRCFDPRTEHSNLFNALDSKTQDLISAEYDDVMLIPSEYAHLIKKGCMSLLFTECCAIDFPNSQNGKYYEEAVGLSSECKYKPSWELTILPIVDEKLVLEDYIFQMDKSEKYYIHLYADEIVTSNDFLIRLGLDDNLFRDGMTVEELEEYLELVTKEETFAPLFED